MSIESPNIDVVSKFEINDRFRDSVQPNLVDPKPIPSPACGGGGCAAGCEGSCNCIDPEPLPGPGSCANCI